MWCDVTDISLEWEIGEPGLNSSRVHYFHTNTLGIGVNPSLLFPAMGWVARQTGPYSLGWQPVKEKGNWIQTSLKRVGFCQTHHCCYGCCTCGALTTLRVMGACCHCDFREGNMLHSQGCKFSRADSEISPLLIHFHLNKLLIKTVL